VSRRATEDLLRLTPRAARAQAEDTFGARLRGWLLRAEVSITECADALDMHRQEVYDLLDPPRKPGEKPEKGKRSFKAAWFELLPKPLRLVALGDIANELGYELRPQAVLTAEHDDDHTAAALVREACETISRITTTLADRQIDRREALDLLRELDELEVAMAPVRARLRQVVERGAMVLPPRPYPTKGDPS
jgi:hypothetical protein